MAITEKNILFADEAYNIVGACMRVQTNMRKGFKEVVYKNAMELEFIKRKIPYEKEKRFYPEYDQTKLPGSFVVDFFCFNSIIVEVKACPHHPDHYKQLLNYLRASKVQLGLLINFSGDRLQYKRIIRSN
jgi:GxxExxY protein